EKLIDILETKENLTIDSKELLIILNNFHNDRIIIENSLNEYQVQREMLCLRTDSSTFVDSIDEIRNLANKTKQSLRLVSSIGKKHLNRFIKSKKDCWLIITDIILFNDDLLQIRDFILSSIDDKIWHICNPSYASKVPLWLIQRCLQVYLSDSTQSSLHLRLEQKILSKKKFTNL
ncbi:unnamed protein product, partial [Rotaria sordida]